ncbi:MAG: hypothetical protein NZ526_07590 [Aquificaceae bacterium]|nr:hypothetical protein [Aquificaceae bacterium]
MEYFKGLSTFKRLLTLFLVLSFGFPFSKEVPFTQEDRERLIRVETKVDVGFQQIDKRFEQVEKRIDDLITFVWILAGVFVAIVGITIGFALWDRRNMVRPFEDRSKKIESELSDTKRKLDTLVDALKELSKKDKEVENLLKKFNLM